jgi:2-oxoisovalerate dehydrogenase E1 component
LANLDTQIPAAFLKRQQPPSELFAQALLIRSVEKRLLDLFAQGKLFGTVHTCIGQEWTGVSVANALEPGDLVFTNHRGHGHYLARTDDVDGLIAEVMGKQTGMCGGKGGSQHMCAQGVFSNGIQGGTVPVAAGMALAQKLRGENRMTVAFIGDGTLGEGALYEALNLASIWQLPMLVLIENNYYAQSTSQRTTLAGDICERAAAFGIETAHADIWDLPNLLETVGSAVRHVRSECKPMFVRVDCYRLMAHSKGDDDRSREEVRSFDAKDPLTIFMREHAEEAAAMNAVIAARIDGAVARADAAAYTAAEAPGPSPVKQVNWTDTTVAESDRMVNLIHASLHRNFTRDPRLIMIGEDIAGPYGGAFKVTKNLSIEFPGRVRNTPISESAIVGFGNGLALQGMKPICEIMFGDFLTLCADQFINHAAKFRYMYNEQVRMPLVIRTPMGGRRGYGPTHSQSIEKHFIGVPDTMVLALHHRIDPGVIYDRLLETADRPTLVIENKLLYGQTVSARAPLGFVYQNTGETFPTTRLKPAGPNDVTIFCYGGMLIEAEKAAEQLFDAHEIIAEIICPVQLYPFNPQPLIDSLKATGKLLVVEEGTAFAALGAEVIAQVNEFAPGALQAVRRIGGPNHPIPSCGPLEKELLPGVSHIVDAAVELHSWEFNGHE